MKSLLTLLLLNVSLLATAQTSRQSTTHSQINDDGKTMSIRIEGQVNGQPIDYQHTFDVARLSGPAKDALKQRIFDSLGVERSEGRTPADAEPPKPPAPPRSPLPPRLPLPPASPGRSESDTPNGESDTDADQNVTFCCETCTGKIKLTVTRSTGDYSFERDTKIDSQKRFFPYQLPLPAGEYRLTYYQNDVLQIQSTFTVKAGQENTVVVK